MIKQSTKLTLIIAALMGGNAYAEHGAFVAKEYDSLGKCSQEVLSKYDGKIVKLEYKSERKHGVYEFDVETPDGKSWDIECDVKRGQVTEVEEEVKADDARFTAIAKVSEADAKAAALAKHPGEVVEVEYELESNGTASYEFDILEADHEEVKIEVDATTGKIVEISYENYQIGQE